VTQFRYWGTTAKNHNLVREEIKRRLNSVQDFLFFCLLHKNVKIRLYKFIILLVVLYGCETLSLTLREEHRLRVFEKVLGRIFGSKGRIRDDGKNCLMRAFKTCKLCQVPRIIRMLKSVTMRWSGHVAGRGGDGNAYRILVGKPEEKRPLG
jgi:hypothetical protein